MSSKLACLTYSSGGKLQQILCDTLFSEVMQAIQVHMRYMDDEKEADKELTCVLGSAYEQHTGHNSEKTCKQQKERNDPRAKHLTPSIPTPKTPEFY